MPKDSVTGAAPTSLSQPAAPRALAVSIGQASRAGVKPVNQDFHGALQPDGPALALKGVLAAVADGISSSAVSGEAAQTAVTALIQDYYATPEAWTVQTAATRVIAATNAWLHGQNSALGDINAGRVCTLSALILKGCEGHVLHVGDSRIARLSGASLEPLTQDHRLVLSASESYLARAMGIAARVEVDYRRVALRPGDVFVLTTDGLHDHIEARDLIAALQAPDLDTAARQLVDLALARGSTDNLTVQILRVDALPEEGALHLDGQALPVIPVPRAGEGLDGFTLLRPLHQGARSHVFLARGPQDSRVVLKFPATDMTCDAEALRRFALEDWIARRVQSAHVVRPVSPPDGRSALYIATEHVEGQSLRAWMTDHPRPDLEQVRDLLSQIAVGLRALHRREMRHQDLRPENVMIDRAGTVKIIDLGACAVAGVEEAAPGLLGDLPGTYQYTAPEYLSGQGGSWRSDQYALGVIGYEMLTGRLPYGAQVARVRNARDQARLVYAPARDAENGLPDWMDAALRRAVHPDPARRYDALSEFIADLRRPGAGWRAGRHVPLAERNPLRFWQGVSAVLGVLCVLLLARLMGG